MSSIYVTEPPPSGKVVLDTSRGEIEVELFADQCPLACKNFIALALEGYYDNITWHRYVPDFIIQSGDPTGTGVGGESYYGKEFEDEPHQRLRFTKRGMLAMANGSDRNSNATQFFITLAATPELQGKHTLFGRISNKTVYNLIALADSVGECEDDRPLYPPKLKTIHVVENPFEGQIQLRTTREERAANRKNRREADKRKSARGPSGVKNKALLSFGEGEGEGEADEGILVLKPGRSIHDTLGAEQQQKPGKRRRRDVERAALEVETAIGAGERTMPAEAGPPTAANTPPLLPSKPSGPSKGREMLQAYRSKYAKAKLPAKNDEETAKLLDSFRSKLHAPRKATVRATDDKVPEELREYGGSDDDDEKDWRTHAFTSAQPVVQDTHRDDEYVTLDPRLDKPDKGRRGRDWVEERSASHRRRGDR